MPRQEDLRVFELTAVQRAPSVSSSALSDQSELASHEYAGVLLTNAVVEREQLLLEHLPNA